MDVLGIILGLSAALGQSASFVVSRIFVVRRQQGAIQLFVFGHFFMAVIGVTILPFLWPANMPALKAYLQPLLIATAAYTIAQISFYITLTRDDASKLAPLLALKVVVLAILSMMFLSVRPDSIQIAGMFLCVGGAILLNFEPGTRAKASLLTLGGILITVCMFATSDLNMVRVLNALEGVARWKASVIGVCLCYTICGVASIPVIFFMRREFVKDIGFAVPYAGLWLGAVIAYFACIAFVGPVFGAMLQSTRGFISILLGFIISALGLVHIERKVSRATAVRRVAAVTIIICGIVLYQLNDFIVFKLRDLLS